jgi:hypothetical protein
MHFKTAILNVISSVILFGIFSCAAAPGTTTNPGGGGTPIVYPAGVYVATNGNDANTGLTKSDPLLSISSAFTTASFNGLQTVYVQEGYYTTNAGFTTFIPISGTASGLTVYGGCDSAFTPQAGHYSVIDAQRARTNIVYMYNVSNFTLNGFVITGSSNIGSAILESAVYLTNTSNCVVTNCIFLSNFGYIGGGLSMHNCYSNVISAIFLYNSAYYGGGCYFKGGLWNRFISSFSNNVSRFSGGGMFIEGYSMTNTISGVFANNVCGTVNGGSGGGLYLGTTYGTNTVVTGCLFVNNTAIYASGSGGSGGGLGSIAPFLTVINCVASNNMASTSGGGFKTSGMSNLISNCVVSSNSVTNVTGGNGAGLCVTGNGIMIDGCSIINNQITNTFVGGGLYLFQSYNSAIQNTVISNNSAHSYGAGMYFGVNTGSNLIKNCVIAGNRITNTGVTGMGGGIYSGGSDTTFFQCMVYNNSTSDNDDLGGGLYISGTNTLVKWCHISNNYSPYGGGIYTANYSEINENQIVSNLALYSGAGVYFTNGIYMLYNNVSANYSVSGGYGAGIYAENAWGTLYINTVGSNLGASYGNGIHIQTSSLTNTQNHFINDGNNISLSVNNTPGGLVFNGNYISGTSTFNTGTAIYEIAADTTNHTFINNYFITNRLGTRLYDNYNSTNDVMNDATWTNINLTNYYGATTAYGNQVMVW